MSINLNSNAEIENPKQRRGDFNIQRELLLLFLISLLATLPIASATNQPYNITVSKKYITATSKCSCGHGTWHYKTVTFYNYDPSSHRWGVLSYSKYADAGQWTSRITDADYCMQCGKEKISGSNLHLIRYYGNSTNSTNIQKNNVTTVKPEPKTPLQVVQSKLHLNMLLN